jgi:membrane protease YdiL (CAAX protease family)
MSKQKKIHQHRFVNRFPALAAVVLTFVTLLLLQTIGSGISIPFGLAIPALGKDSAIGYIIASLLLLWFFKRWLYPEFEGMLHGDVSVGVRLACFIIIYWVICFPIQFLFTPAVFGWPTIGTLSMSLVAGFTEEIAFRGVPVSLLMRQWHSEKKILTTLILTSAIFGLFHATNLFAGADFGSTIFQVIGSAGMGAFFCGLYLRTGNLWISIAVHAIRDILCFLDVAGIQEGVVVQGVTWFSFLDVSCAVGLGILGIWMVRPSKRAEIRQLWDRKWNITNTPEPEIKQELS